MRTDRDYAESLELVEAVMEWIGMRWTTSMIKRQLREFFGKDLSFQTCNYLIKAACKEIRKRYNIDPQYYKGVQIEFYESIIRNIHEKTKNKLTAAERLDKLFGLEQITADDPEVQARKIREALKEMDESIEDNKDGGEQRSTNDGEGKTSNEGNQQSVQSNSEVGNKEASDNREKVEDKTKKENESISEEAIKELKNLKNEDLKRFRNEKK